MSSNMVVQTNVLALNAHRNLKTIGIKQEKASQRLSSGYRINSAADDAAGLAISEKMRAQIRGLDMASKNAQDGISLVQTAEGGMQEIDNMAQRIRELVVQASNDTNDFDTEDRTKIQEEIEQLIQEIDSMAERVEFNAKKLLNGDYADPAAQLASIQAKLAKENLAMGALTTAKTAADAAVAAYLADPANSTFAGLENTWSTEKSAVDANELALETFANDIDTALGAGAFDAMKAAWDGDPANAGKDIKDFYTDLEAARAAATVGVTQGTNDLLDALHEFATGSAAGGGAVLDATAMAAFLGVGSGGAAVTAATQLVDSTGTQVGSYKKLQDERDAMEADAGFAAYAGLEATADKLADDIDAKQDVIDALVVREAAAQAQVNAGAAGGLWFQVGANSEQGIRVGINAINTLEMGIGNGDGTTDDIDVDMADGQQISQILDTLDSALSFISSERSRLGAVQNRLEYTMNSLDISSENLSAAESRIRDTDMAKEMMNLTKANVLQQAATSMLAQANQAPNSILQLLG